jgi:hypothetical protein
MPITIMMYYYFCNHTFLTSPVKNTYSSFDNFYKCIVQRNARKPSALFVFPFLRLMTCNEVL